MHDAEAQLREFQQTNYAAQRFYLTTIVIIMVLFGIISIITSDLVHLVGGIMLASFFFFLFVWNRILIARIRREIGD
jgi:hypothetical protein